MNLLIIKRPVKVTFQKVIIAAVLLSLVLSGTSHSFYGLFYRISRYLTAWWQLYQVRSWETLEGENFTIKYRPEDAGIAHMVLNRAESVVDIIDGDLGLNCCGKSAIVIYPSTSELNGQFGWPADNVTLGVYWGGVIKILSPRVWIGTENPEDVLAVFSREGPIVHEYTHLALDYRTDGNYPQWFTEGLAQYQEYRILGYEWTPERSRLQDKLYTWEELKSFAKLPNQALAYRQAFLTVMYIDRTYGEEAVFAVVDELSRGKRLDAAIEKVTGTPIETFRDSMESWVRQNLHYLK